MTLYQGAHQGERVILIKLESTKGEDALPTEADAATLETFVGTPNDEPVQRNTVTGEQPGRGDISTKQSMGITLSSFVTMQTIAAADDTDAPECDVRLRASGMTRISEAASNSHTYCMGSSQPESATCYEYINNSQKTKGLLCISVGMLGTATLEAEAGKPFMLNCDWMGKNKDPEDPVQEQGSAYLTPYQLDEEREILLQNATIRLYDIDLDALYGGGTLENPGDDGDVVSVSFDFKRDPTLRSGASASGGVHGGWNQAMQGTATIQVELNDFDSVNLYRAQRAKDTFEVSIQVPQPGSPGNTLTLLFYGKITEIGAPDEVADGISIRTLTMNMLYPANVATNSPQAGEQPFSTATSGANRGLPIIPAAGLPNAIFFMQFATA
jgi:hypothetical protein